MEILGRENRQAVEVDFRWNIIIRRQPRTPQGCTTPTHRHTSVHTHSVISTLTATAHFRTGTLAHTGNGHCNRPVHGNNAYARRAGPYQSPILAPIGHVRQALHSTPTCTHDSTNLNGHAISPGPRNTDNKHPPRTPIHVPDIRDRALC